MRENLLKNIHRIFLFGFFVMTQWRCTNAPNGAFNHIPIVKVPTKITSYPLEDYEGELHKYRDDFDSFVFPRDNQELTQYCAFHYQWEDIKVVYSRNKNNEWGYHYIVSKNKRRNR